MSKPEGYLAAGGVVSTLISILHAILAVKPALYRHISAGQETALAQMAEQGSTPTTAATIALALIFGTWALYAFSGAGLINRLPALRAALITIGVIYILRSLFIAAEVNLVLTQGYPFRFAAFSAISLAAGLFYLAGVLKQRAL